VLSEVSRASWSSIEAVEPRIRTPVWTAIVRSDRDAPARKTCGAASLGGVGSQWQWGQCWRGACWWRCRVVKDDRGGTVIWGDTPPCGILRL